MTVRVIHRGENPAGDPDALRDLLDRAHASGLYFEFNGGLGDVILQSSYSDTFAKLDAMGGNDEALIVIFSHNPYAHELFAFHPNGDRITILMLGFSDYRDESNRRRHGLRPHYATPNRLGSESWLPRISDDDRRYLDTLPPRFVTFSLSASAGPGDRRSIPRDIACDLIEGCTSVGIAAVVLGRSYPYIWMQDNSARFPHLEEESIPGATWVIDQLTAAGSIDALRRSVLNVVCESAMAVASWRMRRPTYFLCSRMMWDMFPKNIAILGQGYHFGTVYPENENEVFEDYSRTKFLAYLSKRLTA